MTGNEPGMKIVVVPVTPFRQNCSIVWCTVTGQAAIVDPGGDLDRVTAAVAEAGVTVVKILLTHGHLDHASAARAAAAHYRVPVIGPHRDDAFLLEKLGEQGARYGIAGAASVEPDEWLEDGAVVMVGHLRLEVFHCPGHTPGHVVFFERTERLALVGDVLFRGSVGRTDLPGGSFEQLSHAIRDKLFPLGDDVTFVSGHGDTSTFGWERKCNPFVSDLAAGF